VTDNGQSVVFRDFSRKRQEIAFRVEPDDFQCVPALSIYALQDIMKLYQSDDFKTAREDHNASKIVAILTSIFEFFLLPDAFQIFVKRLSDRKNPIDHVQLLEITGWLIEVYTKRPSQPSQGSSAGSLDGEDGIDSPAGAQLDDSILTNSVVVSSSI
jgi:hypothetical protein